MASLPDPNTVNTGKPVVSVIKIKIDSIEAPDLLAEASEVLATEAKDLLGFLAAQLLLSLDNKTMVILTEWSDSHAWAQSRYDLRVGKLIEHCLVKSTAIEFELYTRYGDVARLP
jgi:heme-degrading monooxygenase HmoA